MHLIDLTHTVADGMPTFPGDPQMSLRQVASIGKNGFTDHLLTTSMHVATHIDAPLHMIPGGKYISDLPLEHFTGPGVLVDVRGKKVIDGNILKQFPITPGSVVLLFSGMDRNYRSPSYDTEYPKITLEAAEFLASKKIKILGIDFINPDTDESYPVHKKLLGNSVLIIENMTHLDKLVGIQTFEVWAVPLKIHADASPVRVFAKAIQ